MVPTKGTVKTGLKDHKGLRGDAQVVKDGHY